MIKLLAAFMFALIGTTSLPTQAQSVQRVTTVIDGALARAGSSNRQPYSESSLRQLCEQGYTLVIYVYKGGSPKEVSCGRGRLRYVTMTNWSRPGSILEVTENEIRRGGKVMIHCWYGVHASNFVTSLALTRLCPINAREASRIFRDGVPPRSLPQSRIDELADKIEAIGGSGEGNMRGCPR